MKVHRFDVETLKHDFKEGCEELHRTC